MQTTSCAKDAPIIAVKNDLIKPVYAIQKAQPLTLLSQHVQQIVLLVDWSP